ncbi:ROK family protein [Arthrobacter sp. NEB 688]|uniref:ROK family protein n=1 Tax=Arthrobacter sp. NEB 688 TaxID=904039 RepID=UPI001562FC20|nr:ROK family protein [Arthrobacter sp. NEB 688]QKE83103.1 ROK family protein [Arthrobacter sp. NEB 688]
MSDPGAPASRGRSTGSGEGRGDGSAVGVDVGGTRIKTVLVQGGSVVARDVQPTPTDLARRFGEVVQGCVQRLLAGAANEGSPTPAPSRVGVVVPGLVDERAGIGEWSANLGWRDLDLLGAVRGRVPGRLAVGHDVRAGLLGEHLLGAARGADDVLFVPLGTGIAVALMTAGRVVRGSSWSGEIGHVVVDPAGPRCGCGRAGCLEALTGAGAVGRRWREAGRDGDARTVAEAVVAGDPVAQRIWNDAVDVLAGALAPVVASAGTRRVVVGGGMAQAGPVLLDPLRTALRTRGPDDALEVVGAELGDWAGAIGAAHLHDAG